jgi:adenine deaminase
MSVTNEISGKIVDVVARRIFQGKVKVKNGTIQEIVECESGPDVYILPGLIDAHIHIESSMLIPSEFARVAVVHGTVATVSDPHEMGNVMGVQGVKFMIDNGKRLPFHFYFGAPSCVPATPFETSGASIGLEELEELLKSEDIYGLAEMMNVPGVLFNDPLVKAKLQLAEKYGKPIDGHAPGLMGEDAETYIAAGISTDHECFTLEEAVWKIQHGMKVLIREGSAARNFDDLMPLVGMYPEMVMFCSDDKHPNDLVKGHINDLVQRAVAAGYNPLDVIRCCTFNPVKHYNLAVGLLQTGDPADFIVVDDMVGFHVLQTYIKGAKVAENGTPLLDSFVEKPLNLFHANVLGCEDITVKPAPGKMRVIKVIEGQLVTDEILEEVTRTEDNVVGNTERDILKLVVKDRYTDKPPAVAFIHGFGLQQGAIASSIAHDSHNIIAVGVDDNSIKEAINLIIHAKGGISVVTEDTRLVLPLPFGGIMSGEDGFVVASRYDHFDSVAKSIGAKPAAPYMTLSFMALLVIPKLKLSDKGLFDGVNFTFTQLFHE